MKKQNLIYFLMFIIPLAHICADICQPSMPFIQHYFQTSITQVQLSLTFFMFGLMSSALIYGPIADILGNRTPLLVGLSITLFATFGCIFATNILFFNIFRLIQGLGLGSTMSLGRSIAATSFSAKELPKILSYLGASAVCLLSLAPFIGGYLQHSFNWQSCFIFVILYLIIILFITFNKLDDPPLKKQRNLLNNAKTVIKQGDFLIYSLIIAMTYAGIIAWITAAPFILQKHFSFSVTACGSIFLLCGLIYAISAFIIGKTTNNSKTPTSRIKQGLSISFINGLLLLFGYITSNKELNPYVFIGHIIIYMISTSFIYPNAFALAFNKTKKVVSTASSILSFIQMLAGLMSSLYISITIFDHIIELGVIFVLLSTISFIFLICKKRTTTKT